MPLPYYAVVEIAVERAETHPEEPVLAAQTNLVITAALQHPQWNTDRILEWHDGQSAQPIEWTVYKFLYDHYILRKTDRLDCRKEIARQIDHLRALLSDPEDVARAAWHSFNDRQNKRRKSWPIIARVVLLQFSTELVDSNDERYQALGKRIQSVLQRVRLRVSTGMLNQIVRGISEERGLAQRETALEKLTALIEEVDEIHTDGQDDADDLQALREQNADLRAALFGLRKELTELEGRIREMQETTETEAVVALLSEMNSPSSNYLLDNLVQSKRTTDDLLQDGWCPDRPEVEGVVYSVKMLLDYLEQIGVVPLQQLGDRAKISMDDLAYIDYSGSEFRDDQQVKWVEFRSPGWSYKDKVISRPRAVEWTTSAESLGG